MMIENYENIKNDNGILYGNSYQCNNGSCQNTALVKI